MTAIILKLRIPSVLGSGVLVYMEQYPSMYTRIWGLPDPQIWGSTVVDPYQTGVFDPQIPPI